MFVRNRNCNDDGDDDDDDNDCCCGGAGGSVVRIQEGNCIEEGTGNLEEEVLLVLVQVVVGLVIFNIMYI